jgi:hypothetical protein
MKRLSLLRHIVLSATLSTSCIKSFQNSKKSSTENIAISSHQIEKPTTEAIKKKATKYLTNKKHTTKHVDVSNANSKRLETE